MAHLGMGAALPQSQGAQQGTKPKTIKLPL